MGIRKFTDHTKTLVRRGIPVPWMIDDTANINALRSNISDAVFQTIGYYTVNTPGFLSKATTDMFSIYVEQSSAAQVTVFVERWRSAYHTWLGIFNASDGLDQRAQHIKETYYRLDDIDIFTLLLYLRKHRLTAPEAMKENPHQVVVTNPCQHSRLSKTLEATLDHVIENWRNKSLKYIIIPFYWRFEWMCLRIEINHEQRAIHILIDDPQGRYGKLWDPEFKYILQQQQQRIYETLLNYFTRIDITDTETYMLKVESIKLDRQGLLCNDTDSGIVMLRSIFDFLKRCDGNYLSNREFIQRQTDPKVYTLQRFKRPKRGDAAYVPSPPATIKLREDLGSAYATLLQDAGTATIIRAYIAESNHTQIQQAMCEHVANHLGCIPKDFLKGQIQPLFEQYAQEGKNYFPSYFITLSFYIRFYLTSTAKKNRKFIVGEHFFNQDETTKLLAYMQRQHRQAASPGSQVPTALALSAQTPVLGRVSSGSSTPGSNAGSPTAVAREGASASSGGSKSKAARRLSSPTKKDKKESKRKKDRRKHKSRSHSPEQPSSGGTAREAVSRNKASRGSSAGGSGSGNASRSSTSSTKRPQQQAQPQKRKSVKSGAASSTKVAHLMAPARREKSSARQTEGIPQKRKSNKPATLISERPKKPHLLATKKQLSAHGSSRPKSRQSSADLPASARRKQKLAVRHATKPPRHPVTGRREHTAVGIPPHVNSARLVIHKGRKTYVGKRRPKHKTKPVHPQHKR